MPAARDILTDVFGFAAFKGEQEAVIEHVVAGGDAVVLMPTGGGKSLCYQIPAIARPGVGVVVSPLIALMQDQVAALTQSGVAAAALNSALAPGAGTEVQRRMLAGGLDLVYVAPERLLTEAFLAHLEHCQVALFAIDEAHCVSQWGHDFRPEYLELTVLAERFPEVPRIALTATADGPTRRDIAERLRLQAARPFVAGFDRPNIRYRVGEKFDPRAQLLAFLEAGHRGASGIVYCQTRRKVDETAAWLAARDVDALPYHAGMEAGARARNQARFVGAEGVVMVATIAFGLGIDKPDVRFVAHLDLPKSLEAYYQETGRAGRDGLAADAWMVHGLADAARLRQFIESSDAADEQKRIEHRKLDALVGYCETTRCRRRVLLEYLGEATQQDCGNCDTCLEPPAGFDGTEAAQKALSCVHRTGRRFGAGHLIDVLLGADTARMRSLGHDRLSTYGIGAEHSRRQWQSIFRQLVSMGYLVVDVAGHGGLKPGQRYRDGLKGAESVRFTRVAETAATKAKAASRPPPEALDDAADIALFEALRARRLELARQQGVPPYVVFGDRTLIEMARERPAGAHEFASLHGVGETKLERYAEAFLEVIEAHREG